MSLTLYHGDCLQVMKDLSANSVDCFICDLPFGCLTQQKGVKPFGRNVKGPSNDGCSWDIKIDLEEFWKQVKRLAKNDHTPVLMFCTTKFGYELIKSNESWFRYDLVWNKQRGVSFLSANKMPMRSHEMIYVFSKSGAYYNRVDIDDPTKKQEKGDVNQKRSANYLNSATLTRSLGAPAGKRCVVSVIDVKKTGTFKQDHPTEKPLELYKWLVERYCPPGGTMLDPTAGSCNSCFAAFELDRHAIGIEKDEGFYKSACTRVDRL